MLTKKHALFRALAKEFHQPIAVAELHRLEALAMQ
jgi:hypothetical protein